MGMNIFKLFGTIAINANGANEEIDETNKNASKLSETLKSGLGTAAKLGGAAVAAAATGLGVLTKSSVEAYAEYEQLVGGIETLFGVGGQTLQEYAEANGKAAEEVQDEWMAATAGQRIALNNAEKAYQTAGLSMNEYMDTVTSFSASLIQSLGGDTEKAAEVADKAIVDMSDNANKMGTSIGMIQNAYQGFAKQNYTMLDNLKLGYGGTQEEMQRLLKDATALSGIEYDISSYADVVEAIHVIQDEMGITGTTAREASETISGSVATAKAAWKNMITALADSNPETYLEGYIEAFSESVAVAAKNIVPTLMKALSGIGTMVTKLAPVLTEAVTKLVTDVVPTLLESGVALIVALVQGIKDNLDQILDATFDVVMMLVDGLTELLPDIVSMGIEFIVKFVAGLIQAIPKIVEKVPEIINAFVSGIVDALPEIVSVGKELMGNFGIGMGESLSVIEDALAKCWEAAQTIWETVGKPVFDMIQNLIGIVRDAFSDYMPEITGFVKQCFSDIGAIWENNLRPCFEAIGNFIENVLAPVFSFVFDNAIRGIIERVFNDIGNIWNDILKPVFTGIIDFITGVFSLDFGKAFEGLVSIIDGIWGSIVTVVKAPINNVIDIINSFIRGLNKLSIPDWIPGVGGMGIDIPTIPLLAKGGILERGQVGLLEGNGAEAVVPLDRNRAWISAVADDMASVGIGGASDREIRELKEEFRAFVRQLPDMMIDAFSVMTFDVNNREFARLVKAVN